MLIHALLISQVGVTFHSTKSSYRLIPLHVHQDPNSFPLSPWPPVVFPPSPLQEISGRAGVAGSRSGVAKRPVISAHERPSTSAIMLTANTSEDMERSARAVKVDRRLQFD